MLFVYYPRCSTCQKAKKWLDEHDIEYEEKDIVKDNPQYDDLKDWHEKSGYPLKKFFMSNQYKHKIETIDVSNRIRAMQGRKGSDESSRYARDRNRARRSREEDENLVRKYIQNPESYTFSKPEKKEEKSSPWYSVLAIVFLLVAFGVGITFGMRQKDKEEEEY